MQLPIQFLYGRELHPLHQMKHITLTNDTDADGDALTAALATNPQYGTNNKPNGTFNYVHDRASISSDNFTYTANDGKVTGAPVTVSIVVTGTNDPPIAANDVIIVPLNGTNTPDNGNNSLLANDSDPDGDALTATLVSSPSFGTLTLNPRYIYLRAKWHTK